MHFCNGSPGNFFGGSAFFNPLFEVPFNPFFGGFRGFSLEEDSALGKD